MCWSAALSADRVNVPGPGKSPGMGRDASSSGMGANGVRAHECGKKVLVFLRQKVSAVGRAAPAPLH